MSSDGRVTRPSRSGIITSRDGEQHVPASTRADGSVRKEIRVRPGYRPPEDVEVYKNRTATAWNSRSGGGVPGALFVEEPQQPTVKKNIPKKKKKARQGDESNEALQLHPEPEVSQKQEQKKDQESEATLAQVDEATMTILGAGDAGVEKEKEARKLSKKLRQARELQQKKEKGGSLLPEQFAKVTRINELIRQLDRLGFDVDGHQKT